MAPSPTDLSAALQSIPEKKEYVRKVFGELEEQRATISRCSGGWKDLDSHLTEIHEALEKRYAEIVDKEIKFEARMVELQAALDKRESVIESREQASLARVQEQKDAAVAAIREQKRKWIEERQLLQSQSPAKPNPDSASSKAKQKDNKVSPKDEAGAKSKAKPDVKDKDAKEKDDASAKKNSQEDTSSKKNSKEDSSSKAKKIKDKTTPQKNQESSKPEEEKKRKSETEAEADKKQETEEQEEDGGDKQDSEIGNAEDFEDQPQAMEVGDEDGAKSGDDSDGVKDEDDKEESHKKEENVQPSVKVRPQLTSLCENMDGPGLRSFLTAQKKDINLIRKELPTALKCASDPLQLVLKAIEGYYSSEPSAEGTQGKKLANRRSCITLLESLGVVLADGEKDESGVSENIKEEVKMVADLWKSKLNPKGTDQTALLDAQSFLQLIATFGLAKEYDEDELCDLVIPICTRKHVPALCRKLGLANKAPG